MEKKNRVQRAVVLAAGLGNRMRPLTDMIPKPLVKVNGICMIDTIIEALQKNGIFEIHVVIGYKKEQFQEWVKKYPDIHLIENPWFESCNNISSLYAAKSYLKECMILDGDQIICSPSVLRPEFTVSGYNAVWSEGFTNEWLMEVEEGVVKHCSRVGGEHGWQLFSVSRWSEEDGKKLAEYTAEEFERGNTQIYWDDVPMFCHFDEFKLGIREMDPGDIVEFDSLEELIRVDPTYRKYLTA